MKKFMQCFAKVTCLAMMAVSMTSMAQTVTFTEQTQFVIAKGNGSVNIRKAPNAKAAKVAAMYADQSLPVLKEQGGWYQVQTTSAETGWVSATVVRKNDATLNAGKVCDHVYGLSEDYEDYVEWYVGRVEDTDTYLAFTVSSNMEGPIGCPWFETLWMGRKVGNVLVFDQYVPFGTTTSEDAGELKLFDQDFDGGKGCFLRYGSKYAMPDNQGGEVLRLSALPMNTVRQIFDGRQKKDRRLFLGPQLFGTKYANIVLG